MPRVAPINSAAANGDDLSNNGSANDEDGITAPLPALDVSDASYSVTVSVLNNTGAAQTLQGWIDFNENGVFEPGERADRFGPDQAALQSVTLTLGHPAGDQGRPELSAPPALADNILAVGPGPVDGRCDRQ